MKLGEMLVRDGRLTEAQLQQAIDQQKRDGGRLGTVMVEMGLVDLDALTVYLGLELGIPMATGATLDRAKRSAVRLLSPGNAARYRCVPILVQDRQLIAALDDPHDLPALDDLARLTGYRILPRVAPEIRIYYYLERYYGVARPPRFLVFGDAPRGTRRTDPGLPAAALPGLPPLASAPVRAPTPPPVLPAVARPERKPRPAPPPVAAATNDAVEEFEALEIDAEDLLVELEADDAATAERAGPGEALSEGAPPGAGHLPAPAEAWEPLDIEDAIATMARVTQRGDVADAIMGYAAGMFEVAALCIVRDHMAFGWKGFGPGLDRDRIETLLLPLAAPSILQTAIAGDQIFRGTPFPSTLHNYLYKVLRCPQPESAVVAVITIGKRIVNLLYGHRENGAPMSEIDLEGLREVARAATEAYVRLIAGSKQTSGEGRRAGREDREPPSSGT
jgi:hypothetical protein